ncbi:MAG: 3-dehydroquinate synthase [Victivallales bacterium]|nr:3-dehydroquinate synthase [Victivallales bacterium]
MPTIQVHTTPPYSIRIQHGWPVLPSLQATEVYIVSDSNVGELYLGEVHGLFAHAGIRQYGQTFPAGESSKHLGTVQSLLEGFAEFGLTRSGLVVALGGGVVGDVAGFAASIWLRGVPFLQFPTTLLAMVDSSIGGKTGVDLDQGKNLVGSFHQPSGVFANVDTLRTLPQEYIEDGLAEMLKTCVLQDASLFERIVTKPSVALEPESIARCAEIKANIVEQDPTEKGVRKLLNLGHTAAHAIELASNFQISHGHAVAIGMAMVARAGFSAGITSAKCRNAILHGLEATGLGTRSPYPVADLMAAMKRDKKRAGGTISLIVPRELGQCEILPMPLEQLEAFYEAAND